MWRKGVSALVGWEEEMLARETVDVDGVELVWRGEVRMLARKETMSWMPFCGLEREVVRGGVELGSGGHIRIEKRVGLS